MVVFMKSTTSSCLQVRNQPLLNSELSFYRVSDLLNDGMKHCMSLALSLETQKCIEIC